MTISGQAHVSASSNVLVQNLDGEAVLLDLESGRYFGLDEVGARFWQVLAEAPSVEAAYETLAAEYDVDREKLRQDLYALLDELVEHQLITVSDG
jgi:hypothetical protein